MATTTTYSPTIADRKSPSKRGQKSGCGCGCGGGCPACKGLECMERPRYFAGQLLTEAELNSEQAYVIAKNRLHNRYLHGWGVVCGLEVVCSDCAGWVRIREGYAIDPCGNDIVVCRERDFNVVEAINKCLDAKRSRDGECLPWQDPNADCKDEEEHWCVTIAYDEVQAKPAMPLRQEGTSSCQSGCGCGGGKKKSAKASASKSPCGCGGGCGDAPAPPKSNARGAACEPTRILEGYKLEIVCQPTECRDAHDKQTFAITSRTQAATLAANPRIGPMSASMIGAIAPDALTGNAWFRAALTLEDDDSLLTRILDVFTEVEEFLGDRLSAVEMRQLADAFKQLVEREGGKKADAPLAVTTWTDGSQPAVGTTLCCRFRRALQELYSNNPLGVRCAGFNCPPCEAEPQQPPSPNPSTGIGAGTITPPPTPSVGTVSTTPPPSIDPGAGPITTPPRNEALYCLLNALVDYIVDAVCLKLLPPCPPTPCDDRLILACVTVRNGKIVHICNFACRHYAGSFNSLAYWTSAVPIVSVITSIVRKICCAPHALTAILRGGQDDATSIAQPGLIAGQPNG